MFVPTGLKRVSTTLRALAAQHRLPALNPDQLRWLSAIAHTSSPAACRDGGASDAAGTGVAVGGRTAVAVTTTSTCTSFSTSYLFLDLDLFYDLNRDFADDLDFFHDLDRDFLLDFSDDFLLDFDGDLDLDLSDDFFWTSTGTSTSTVRMISV